MASGRARQEGLIRSRLMQPVSLLVGHGPAMRLQAGFPASAIVQLPEPLVAPVENEPVARPNRRLAPRHAEVRPVRAVDAQHRDPLVEELQLIEPPALHPVARIDADPPLGSRRPSPAVPRSRRPPGRSTGAGPSPSRRACAARSIRSWQAARGPTTRPQSHPPRSKPSARVVTPTNERTSVEASVTNPALPTSIIRIRIRRRTGLSTMRSDSEVVKPTPVRDPNRKNHYSRNNYKKMRQMSEQARDKNACLDSHAEKKD